MPTLKFDFELRRVIFGLTSIISANANSLPAIVTQRLPDIFKQLAALSLKMKDQRMKILKDNEEHLQEQEAKRAKGEKSDDEEEVEGDEGETEEVSDDEDEGEGKTKAGRKKSEVDDDADDGVDDSDDSDYEYTGGDLAIYDSALDDVDELLYIKDTLEKLNSLNATYVGGLFSGLAPEELQKFNENMQSAQALKDREEVVRKLCDEEFERKN